MTGSESGGKYIKGKGKVVKVQGKEVVVSESREK